MSDSSSVVPLLLICQSASQSSWMKPGVSRAVQAIASNIWRVRFRPPVAKRFFMNVKNSSASMFPTLNAAAEW